MSSSDAPERHSPSFAESSDGDDFHADVGDNPYVHSPPPSSAVSVTFISPQRQKNHGYYILNFL